MLVFFISSPAVVQRPATFHRLGKTGHQRLGLLLFGCQILLPGGHQYLQQQDKQIRLSRLGIQPDLGILQGIGHGGPVGCHQGGQLLSQFHLLLSRRLPHGLLECIEQLARLLLDRSRRGSQRQRSRRQAIDFFGIRIGAVQQFIIAGRGCIFLFDQPVHKTLDLFFGQGQRRGGGIGLQQRRNLFRCQSHRRGGCLLFFRGRRSCRLARRRFRCTCQGGRFRRGRRHRGCLRGFLRWRLRHGGLQQYRNLLRRQAAFGGALSQGGIQLCHQGGDARTVLGFGGIQLRLALF